MAISQVHLLLSSQKQEEIFQARPETRLEKQAWYEHPQERHQIGRGPLPASWLRNELLLRSRCVAHDRDSSHHFGHGAHAWYLCLLRQSVRGSRLLIQPVYAW